MREQKYSQIKRQKTPVLVQISSVEILPSSFSRQNRKKSIQTFKEFQNALSSLKLKSRSHSLKRLNPQQTKLLNRQVYEYGQNKKIDVLDVKLKQKLLKDDILNYALIKDIQQLSNRKSILQRKLNEINNRNSLRIKQIQQFEQKVVERYKNDYLKDKQQYNKLNDAYLKVIEQQKSFNQKYKMKKQKVNEDKQKILQQQKRFINFINNLQRSNTVIPEQIIQQTPSKSQKIIKKIEINSEKTTSISKHSSFQKLSITKQKSDIKGIGDQYMQQNKKMSLKNKKIKQINNAINLKSIDYNPQIKIKIQRNQKILSDIQPQRKSQSKIHTVSHGIQHQIKKSKLSLSNSFQN